MVTVRKIFQKKSVADFSATDFSVGVVRLELTTTCTPCKYASQLRHTPPFLREQR